MEAAFFFFWGYVGQRGGNHGSFNESRRRGCGLFARDAAGARPHGVPHRAAGRAAHGGAHGARARDGRAGAEPFDYAKYLAGLGRENRYGSVDAFVRGYFFDRRNPEALRAAALALAQGVLAMKDALGTGAQKPVIWQHLQRLLVLADGAVLPLDLAALYRLQVQGQLLAKNGRLIAPREELRAAVEHVFRV